MHHPLRSGRCRKNLPLSGTSVNSNPYNSPTPARSVAATPSSDRNLVHIAVLAFIFLFTLILALINSIGEQLPSISFALVVTLASVISQLPGIIVGFSRLEETLEQPSSSCFPRTLSPQLGCWLISLTHLMGRLTRSTARPTCMLLCFQCCTVSLLLCPISLLPSL